jgi:hypothetical protein
MVSQLSKPESYRIIDRIESARFETTTGEQQVIAAHNYKMLWTYAVNVILAFWLITGPSLYNYQSRPLVVSDIVSGALIIGLECLSFFSMFFMVRWLTPVVGLWLLFAPLMFWSPTPTVFLLDTLIGSIVISMSLLIPGTPGSAGIPIPGPDIPPNWSYNPSSWIRRWLGIALALFGFFISRYLAARQLGYITHPWDPFFATASTDRVLHSVVSRSFPISDAGFGSVAYLLEVLAGFMGDRARWRTAPWVVTTFAVLVVPLGITSIILVILQPVVVGAWCGLCLLAAIALLISVPLAVHEIIAMGLFILAAKQRGKSVWRVFFFGGTIEGAGNADPDRSKFSIGQRWVASVQGITVPWLIAFQIAIGAWLMARPDLIHASKITANIDHLLGAIIVTVAAVATAEVTRTARWLNVVAGVCLVIAAFLLAMNLPLVFWSELICGLILIPIALPRGEIIERYDGWDRCIK